MSDESTERLPEERQFSMVLMGSCATAGAFCSFSSRLKESPAALRSHLPLAVPAFELFVKRERPQQVSYRILPNSSNSASGGLISVVAAVSSRCATRAVLPRSASDSEPCAKSR